MDLVAETGLPIEDLKNNPEIKSLIMKHKFVVITDTDDPSKDQANNCGQPSKKPVVEAPKEVIPEEPKEEVVVVSDIIEEEVDEEEIKRAILEESLRIDDELLGRGEEDSPEDDEDEEDECISNCCCNRDNFKF
jgi:hypothetical protein